MTSHFKKPHRAWAVQDAKAKFSEFLDAAANEGPQIVTRRGVETAVLVPINEWKRLSEQAGAPTEDRPTLKELLLSDPRRFDLDIPPRGEWKHRPPVDLE